MRRMKGQEKRADGTPRGVALGALAVVGAVAASVLVLVAGPAAGDDVDQVVPVADRREAVLPAPPETAALPKLEVEAVSGG